MVPLLNQPVRGGDPEEPGEMAFTRRPFGPSSLATAGIVGDWWTLLLLPDALDRYTRCDQFQRNLNISTSILTAGSRHWSRRDPRTQALSGEPASLPFPSRFTCALLCVLFYVCTFKKLVRD
jgi:hypothetical protein